MMMPAYPTVPQPGAYPTYPYQQQPYQQQPYAQQPYAQGAAAVPASTPIPILRPQIPEPATPPRQPVRLPPPEQLGIGTTPARTAAEEPLDWNAIHRRMEEAGIQTHLLTSLSSGGYRLSCWIPTAEPGVLRRIEAEAGTRAEVFRLALEQAARRSH